MMYLHACQTVAIVVELDYSCFLYLSVPPLCSLFPLFFSCLSFVYIFMYCIFGGWAYFHLFVVDNRIIRFAEGHRTSAGNIRIEHDPT